MVLRCDRHQAGAKPHDRVMLRVDFFVLLQDHFHASKDQKTAKNIEYPMKGLEQGHPHGNRQATQDEGPEDAPK